MASKNVLITGAAQRIGVACARFLHQQGCNIILHYHASAEAAKQVCEELNAIRPASCLTVQADLRNLAELHKLAETALDHWQGIDVLVNNASQFFPGSLGEVTEIEWDSLLGSNLKAPFFLSQALSASLRERQGCIVNIVDIYAERSLPAYPVYSIAKAGLAALTQALAKELAPQVRVNAIAPGAILWPQSEPDAEQQRQILQRVALQRSGQPVDIAQALWFLIAQAEYITGHTLCVDGGRRLFI